MRVNFCLECGAHLETRDLDGRPRSVCPFCGWVFFQQLKVGAGVLVARDGRLLLLRREREPFAGAWNLPAGYVEVDESPAKTAQRETLEETGLIVQTSDLVDAYFFCDDPRGSGILLVYDCVESGGTLHLNNENSESRFFLPGEIPVILSGGGHDRAIMKWKRRNE